MDSEQLKKAQIVTFINMKGGVGKTNLTKEIGYYLAKERKKKILLVDLDPQSNLTQSFFKKYHFKLSNDIENLGDLIDLEDPENTNENSSITFKEENSTSVEPILTEASIQKLFSPGKVKSLTKEDCIVKLDDHLDIIPGTLKAMFLERNSNIENHLHNYIDNLKLREEYDYIFIDSPPTYSNYTIAAIISSDFYITPSKPDAYSVLGIQMLHEAVEQIKDHQQVYFNNRELKSLGVVFTNLQPKTSGVLRNRDLIKDSKRLKEIGIEFFDAEFVYNPEISKKAEYFITDSKSNTKANLIVLVDEFLKALMPEKDEKKDEKNE